MRIVISPVVDPQREIDLTQRLVAAIAEELWRLYRGSEQLNWLEAELHFQRIVGEARAEAGLTDFVFVEPLVAGGVAEEPAVARAVEPRRKPRGRSRSASRPRTARPVRRQMAVIA